MIVKKQKDWFKVKRYPHIGLPLKNNERHKWIEKYVTNPDKVAKHSFLPFIHKTSRVRKFRKSYLPCSGSLNKKFKDGKKIFRKDNAKKKGIVLCQPFGFSYF